MVGSSCTRNLSRKTDSLIKTYHAIHLLNYNLAIRRFYTHSKWLLFFHFFEKFPTNDIFNDTSFSCKHSTLKLIKSISSNLIETKKYPFCGSAGYSSYFELANYFQAILTATIRFDPKRVYLKTSSIPSNQLVSYGHTSYPAKPHGLHNTRREQSYLRSQAQKHESPAVVTIYPRDPPIPARRTRKAERASRPPTRRARISLQLGRPARTCAGNEFNCASALCTRAWRALGRIIVSGSARARPRISVPFAAALASRNHRYCSTLICPLLPARAFSSRPCIMESGWCANSRIDGFWSNGICVVLENFSRML